MLVERPELSGAIRGVWSVLTAELVSGRSCRDGAGTGNYRTARRWVGELPGVEAMLGGIPGATKTVRAVRTTWRSLAEKAEDGAGAGGYGGG